MFAFVSVHEVSAYLSITCNLGVPQEFFTQSVFSAKSETNRMKIDFFFFFKTITKAPDFLEKLVLKRKISHEINFMGVCTDRTPITIGTRSGFQISVKTTSPNIKYTYCLIHRRDLALKTLPISSGTDLDQITKIVNFIKVGALDSRNFQQLCSETDANYNFYLFLTNVRWLSKENVTKRVFELKDKLIFFYEQHRKIEYFDWLIYKNLYDFCSRYQW